jgi:hypothetical protein
LSDDLIAKLRAELDGLSGPVRLGPLTRLGQALAERQWRAGLGTPGALPDLNGAIAALEEAHGYMAVGDGLRAHVAGQLGWLLAARHNFTDAEEDRETGIRMLEEAVAAPNLSAILLAMCRIALGGFYLGRLTPVFHKLFQEPGMAMRLLTKGVQPEEAEHAEDATRAVDCFRKVLEAEPINDVTIEVAEAMLALTETMQTLLAGPAGGLDMQRLMEAAAVLQKLQGRFTRSGPPGSGFRGSGSFLAFGDFQKILTLPPLDRPVTVVHQVESDPEPAAEPVRSPRPPVAPNPIDREQLRRSLHDVLLGTGGTDPIWASAAALLLPTAPALPVDVVDEVVALARMIVDTEDDDAGSVGVDWFVLAVTLCLRDRLDVGGDHADRLAGAESLLTAVEKVPIDHPAATTMLLSLGAFLEEDRPFGGVLDAVADDFADRLDAAITAGVAKDAAELATLHALRCLCHAASAMAELGRAAVPPDYPWQAVLKAATRAAG